MIYQLHLIIGMALQFAAFFVIAFNSDEFGFSAIFKIIVCALAIWFLWRLVPARCPSGNCDGKAYAKGSRPIRYECSKCGYVHVTSVSEGDHSG